MQDMGLSRFLKIVRIRDQTSFDQNRNLRIDSRLVKKSQRYQMTTSMSLRKQKAIIHLRLVFIYFNSILFGTCPTQDEISFHRAKQNKIFEMS